MSNDKPYFETHKHQNYLNEKPWIDTRLNEEEMNFLRHAISKENKKNYSKELAGNISKSELIDDKNDWFYKTTLKKLTENIFYRYQNNIDDKVSPFKSLEYPEGEPPPEFKLEELWVNYQKQYEFNPLHGHRGFCSFVVFMKIPTHWEEQHSLFDHTNYPSASNFAFVWSKSDTSKIFKCTFPLSPKDEGRMLFFPAWLEHLVNPFYGTEEERVTISGNINLWE
jgi:hypothetical protein|tara:strand:- start:1465 stop:2136 length:672 start_codon:yes stop_codon:yes gene_type:complete